MEYLYAINIFIKIGIAKFKRFYYYLIFSIFCQNSSIIISQVLQVNGWILLVQGIRFPPLPPSILSVAQLKNVKVNTSSILCY